MDTLQINTGVKRIAITDMDGEVRGEISFNPSDLLFAEKFYKALGDIEVRMREYQRRAEELDEDKSTDAAGLPTNMPERIALLRETCEFIKGLIDSVFGEGTSQTVFEDAISLDMFEQFLGGIAPYFQQARTLKVKKYLPPEATLPKKPRSRK